MNAPAQRRRDRIALSIAYFLGEWRWEDIAIGGGLIGYLLFMWLH